METVNNLRSLMATTTHTRTIAERTATARPIAAQLTRLATYSTVLASIYLAVGSVFYYASREKLITDSGTMPAGLVKAFHGSFFASVPGDNAAWVLLGLIEAAVFVVLAISLLSGEFLPQRRKPILLAGLGLSILAYGVMIVANAMTGNTATEIVLFTYLGVTVAVMFLVRQMAPYRPMSWLAGEADATDSGATDSGAAGTHA
jgi:hypothetical protein